MSWCRGQPASLPGHLLPTVPHPQPPKAGAAASGKTLEAEDLGSGCNLLWAVALANCCASLCLHLFHEDNNVG